MGLSYDHAAGRRVAKRVRNMADRTQDVSKTWPKIGAYLSRQVRRQFSTRGKHMGTPWKPLKRSTLKEKRNLGFSRIPLVRKGDLRQSFVGRPMNIELYGKQRATFGSSLNTAVWQQRGTYRGGRRAIPPRPILQVTPEMRVQIKGTLQKYIVGRGKGSTGIS